MQDTEPEVSAEDSESAEDQTPQGNLTDTDLLSYLEGNESEETSEEPVATEESEAEAEESDETVLSQSDDTDDEMEEEAEEGEPEDAPPKSTQKLLRQVGKLTARAKGAEERYDALKAEIDSLKADKPKEENANPSVEECQTFDDLEKLRQEAISAKKWARSHAGEDFVQEGDAEYTREQIRDILHNAEDCLDEHIPERMKHIQEKVTSDENAEKAFGHFLQNEDSAEYKLMQELNSNERYDALDKLPNGLYMKGLIVEGAMSLRARGQVQGKGKTGKQKPVPPSSPVGELSPPQSSTKKDKRKVLGKGNVSEEQLVAFLTE